MLCNNFLNLIRLVLKLFLISILLLSNNNLLFTAASTTTARWVLYLDRILNLLWSVQVFGHLRASLRDLLCLRESLGQKCPLIVVRGSLRNLNGTRGGRRAELVPRETTTDQGLGRLVERGLHWIVLDRGLRTLLELALEGSGLAWGARGGGHVESQAELLRTAWSSRSLSQSYNRCGRLPALPKSTIIQHGCRCLSTSPFASICGCRPYRRWFFRRGLLLFPLRCLFDRNVYLRHFRGLFKSLLENHFLLSFLFDQMILLLLPCRNWYHFYPWLELLPAEHFLMRLIDTARGEDFLAHKKLLMLSPCSAALGRGILDLTYFFACEILRVLLLGLGFVMGMLQRFMNLRGVKRRFFIFLVIIKFSWAVMLWWVGMKMGFNCISDILELLFTWCRYTMNWVMINQICQLMRMMLTIFRLVFRSYSLRCSRHRLYLLIQSSIIVYFIILHIIWFIWTCMNISLLVILYRHQRNLLWLLYTVNAWTT